MEKSMEKCYPKAAMKRYPLGIIYITVCLHPDKKGMLYIGSHCLNNTEYLGSGGLLRHYINKFGRRFFRRTTICEYSNITRDELLTYENSWIAALDALNSPLFWNQRSRASGGYVIKDLVAHSEKTKQGMLKSNAVFKIKANARQPKNIQTSIQKLLSLTTEQKKKAYVTRSKGSWYKNICARNKSMAQTTEWQHATAAGRLYRDKFIKTPIGTFKNAVDAGKVFCVSNVAILNRAASDSMDDWGFVHDKDTHIIDPSIYSENERNQLHRTYFSKVAHNKKQVTVEGKIYESKTHARQILKWSQSRLETYLSKQGYNNEH